MLSDKSASSTPQQVSLYCLAAPEEAACELETNKAVKQQNEEQGVVGVSGEQLKEGLDSNSCKDDKQIEDILTTEGIKSGLQDFPERSVLPLQSTLEVVGWFFDDHFNSDCSLHCGKTSNIHACYEKGHC